MTPSNFESLERTFHEPKRLAILSALAAGTEGLSFQDLKSDCRLTDGNLNRHLKVLQESAIISQKKTIRNERISTQIRLTARGRKAFIQYLESLEAVLKEAQGAIDTSTASKSTLPLGRKARA